MRSMKQGNLEWALLLAALIAFALCVLFDIHYIRPLLGLFIFILVPGWMLLLVIEEDRLEFWERIAFSVGLSIFFLMLLGAMANWLYYDLGVMKPLSLQYLLPTFMAGIIILSILAWRRNISPLAVNIHDLKRMLLDPMLLIALLFPIFGALGAELMNTSNNNTVVLGVYLGIAAYVIFMTLTKQRQSHIYATAIWAIGLTLLLMYSLRSEHILGYDVHGELSLFQAITLASRWDASANLGPLNGCLSVVILPPVIKSLFNIGSEYVYKVVYALFFSITPLAIFLLSRKYIADRLAFLVSIFFMSQSTFFMASQSNPRTSLALLFFALFLFALFNDKISRVNKILLSIIFSAGIIVSHYSTAYIFLAVIIAGFAAGYIAKIRSLHSNHIISPRYVIILLSFTFVWYAQVTQANFEKGVRVVTSILMSMGGFFVEESRQEGTLKVMGLGAKSLGDYSYSASHYIISLFIAIGLLILFYTRFKGIRPGVLSREIEIEHLGMMTASALILASIVIVPRLSFAYTADRLWTQAMVMLSLPFVLGCCFLAGKRRTALNLLLLTVLLFQFANANYLVYQATGEPRSLVLNSMGPDYGHFFIHNTEVVSSKWLAREMRQDSQIYSDFDGAERLSAGPRTNWQGRNFFRYMPSLSKSDYIYLSYNNVILKTVFTGRDFRPLENFSSTLFSEQKIYDNGESQILG